MPLDSSSLAAVGVTAPPAGPIAKVPPEVLVHILRWLRAIHSRRCDYQADAHHFMLVCKEFYPAHALSDGAREYVVGTASQAAALTQRVRPEQGGGLGVEELWIELPLDDMGWMDRVVARLVQGCGRSLRGFVWDPRGEDDRSGGMVNSALVEAWATCGKLETVSLLHARREMWWADVKFLLAAWPNLRTLDWLQVSLDFSDPAPASIDLSSWIIPTHLCSLKLSLDCDDGVALLGALVATSAPSLRHLAFRCSDLDGSELGEQVRDALLPVARTLSGLKYACDFPDWHERTFDWVAPALKTLTNLDRLELPVAAALWAEGLGGLLRGRKPASHLVLSNPTRFGTDCTPPSVVAEALDGLGVQDLWLSAAWLEELDDLGEGEGEADLSVEELAARKGEWKSRLEGLAPKFAWV